MSKLYIDVKTLNYRGDVSLSGYTLPTSYFTFIPNLTSVDQIVSIKNVVWDFGDGTTSFEIQPQHAYKFPGIYGVTLTVFNNNGDAIGNSYVPGVSVFDYIYDDLIVDAPSAFNVKAGHYTSYTLLRQNSWRTVKANTSGAYTVSLYASGGLAPALDIDLYNNSQWSHLLQHTKFLDKRIAGYSYEYVPVTEIATTNTVIYVNQDTNGDFKQCLSTDPGAVIAGCTGYATPYFTSDTPKNYLSSGESSVVIFNTLNPLKIVDTLTIDKDLSDFVGTNYFNTKPAVIPNTLIRYNSASKLTFSTNGIDTEGDAILSTFDIPAISWQHTKIPFIVRLEDDNGFATKFYPTLTAGNTNTSYIVSLCALSGSVLLDGSFYTDFTSAAPLDLGGYFKGYYISPSAANNVTLKASVQIEDPKYWDPNTNTYIASATRIVTGSSNTFNILPYVGSYSIAKINEDFNFKSFWSSLRFQERQFNFTELFDNLLGYSFGDSQSEPYELGKTIYEKIANFTDNTSNIDTANVQALLSMCNEVGITLEPVNYEYPAQIKRIVDLLSIKHKKLFGDSNKFDRDFNNYNSTNSNFAKNIGTLIDPITGTFSLSSNIVAYEIYSGTYNLVRTAKLSGYSLSDTLPLSDYNNTWGWSIHAPTSVSGTEISTYYKFYLHNNTPEGSIHDSIINWNDTTTTLSFYTSSYLDWSNNDGIMDNIINYELTKGLRLFTSAANITYNN